MLTPALWLIALAPLALAAIGLVPAADTTRRAPSTVIRLAVAAAALALAIAAATGISVVLNGPMRTGTAGLQGVGFGLYLDALSATMFCLVSFIGLIVIFYSRNYLDGDPGQARFIKWLCLTLASILTVIISGNLLQLTLAWIATSLSLHHLLVFYRERPAAILAARKKFVASRLGDLCLVAEMALLYTAFGSLDYATIFPAAGAMREAGAAPGAIHAAAIFLVIAALLKSAQLPLHGWLIEVMETPTPVSALLHAGIINAGGFLVLRFANVIALSVPSLDLLAIIGGFTALFGSVVMLTQTSIKVSLAYSTIAQMGFMLLECGLGAFSAALLHILAHSLYKAHAFLSSGSVIDIARASWTPSPGGKPHQARLVIAIAAVLLVTLAVSTLSGATLTAQPGVFALGAVLLLGLVHLVASGIDERPNSYVIARTLALATVVAVVYFGLQLAAERLLDGSLPPTESLRGPVDLAIVAAVILSFAIVTFFQSLVPKQAKEPRWQALYAHVSNGLYINTLANRLVLRFLPRPDTAGEAATPNGAPGSSGFETDALPVEMDRAAFEAAIAGACNRIAPLWPLKHFVAVNPFLGFSGQSFHATCAMMRRVARVDMLMPRAFYREALAGGVLEDSDLAGALAAAPKDWRIPETVAELKYALGTDPVAKPKHRAHVVTVAEVLDTLAAGDRRVSGTEFMTDEISKWCAAYFDEGQSVWRLPSRSLRPYSAWRASMRYDRNPETMGVADFRAMVADMPDDPVEAIVAVIDRLGVPQRAVEDYLHQALLEISGWAAYARYLVWNSNLYGREDDTLIELLAIRVVWGYALFMQRRDAAFLEAWRRAMAEAATMPLDDRLGDDLDLGVEMVLQEAYEAAFQRRLLGKLAQNAGIALPPVPIARKQVQAAFCIDVRSEIYRRALETVSSNVETIGFAGFYGFPIEYVPIGHLKGGAQCPVLLTPTFIVCEAVGDAATDEEQEILGLRLLRRRVAKAWKSFKLSAVSSFIYVKTAGLLFAGKIASDSLGLTRTVNDPNTDGLDPAVIGRLGPRIEARDVGGRLTGFTDEGRLTQAEAVLRAMSLTANFARLVMLTGHGSTTVNNPHASGLDCGACGGHTGEANARVAAAVLNDQGVRLALSGRGIDVPEDTFFLGALHDTTTDDIKIFGADKVPASHSGEIERLRGWLAQASALARMERAALLGVPGGPGTNKNVIARSRDWSQVRPEWGLAGNAAFIAAPRERTQGIDLGGRAFLHNYDWRRDADFSVLELIMTAPMVVANWINLQYYGSTVNNRVFGSGNKTLHNVTGTLGVLEGNAGDLKAGLPWQSVHDGRRFVHEPLRLNVFIEAPIEALNGAIAKHETVKHLLDNRWLHLFAISEKGVVTHTYQKDLVWRSLA
jgi:uncharacterized protein YbcC (UPF0753/DUF2309 family)/NADH:ubiquinone oxidoreductase subunit 5 (subunit L)/multisubunit Na+/H+ antiporter MnhA subunit